MDFKLVERQLKTRNSNLSASELHGVVVGWLCAGARQAEITRSAAMQDWFAEEPGDVLHRLVQTLSIQALAALEDMALDFQLCLPDDEVDINVRQQCLSRWCGGFISGFGLAGRHQETELHQDVREVMGDLSSIAAMDEDIPDDNENEADMTEIIEYVRMAALMVFTECANDAVHQAEAALHPAASICKE